MQSVYEDKVNGKMPEEVCFVFIEKYTAEQKILTSEIGELEKKLTDMENTRSRAPTNLYGI